MPKQFKLKQKVYDRWWRFRPGTVIKVLKTRIYVQWFDGEVTRYDKAHQQFLEVEYAKLPRRK